MTSIKSKTLKLDYFSSMKAFFNLMKPRVMSLVIFTCAVGLLIAPVKINFVDAICSLMAVALGSGAAGALNMWYESDLDSLMTRTCLRPIPTGKLTRNQALTFGIFSSLISVVALYFFSNLIAAITLAVTILFYVFVYTVWLKRKTPQNIVIGGAAGALPPVIGWAIATNTISLEPIILFLIIFFMLVKAGLIMAIFMHLYWERWAIVNVLLWPMTALGVFIAIMVSESYYTFFTRMFYFVVGS